MRTQVQARIDPWRVEFVVVRDGSHSDGERSALRRDLARGLLTRLVPGAYVERAAFESLGPEDRHLVRMRATAAASDRPVVFSHWSAAVLHGLPVLAHRLGTPHVTVPSAEVRPRGAAGHVFALQELEVVRFQELLATGVGRTVVDVAGSSPFEEGVMAADGALRAGVPRDLLLNAVDRAGPRRASCRIGEVVGFAHPGAESAAESRFRVTLLRLGVEVPVLQYRIALRGGSNAFLDGYLPTARVGVEVDGDLKYLDAQMAPESAAAAVLAEKRREDEVRLHLHALVRPGWVQSGSATQLRALLARVGVGPARPRPTLSDYAAVAAHAQPRTRIPAPAWRA